MNINLESNMTEWETCKLSKVDISKINKFEDIVQEYRKIQKILEKMNGINRKSKIEELFENQPAYILGN